MISVSPEAGRAVVHHYDQLDLGVGHVSIHLLMLRGGQRAKVELPVVSGGGAFAVGNTGNIDQSEDSIYQSHSPGKLLIYNIETGVDCVVKIQLLCTHKVVSRGNIDVQ